MEGLGTGVHDVEIPKNQQRIIYKKVEDEVVNLTHQFY